VVVVVEHDDKLTADYLENLVQEHVNGARWIAGDLVSRLPQVGKRDVAEAWHGLPDSVREIFEEDKRVGVRVVELIPDELACVCLDEARDECSFTGASGGGDERDRVREVGLEAFDQARA
jgi:hypothetical protein